MAIDIVRAAPQDILPLRELYCEEMNCQIIHYSWHDRGWTDSYLLRVDGAVVGYGLVGGVNANPKEVITEFYVLPAHRAHALPLFRGLVDASRARSVEAQTNDKLLTLMLYDCAERIESDTVLFEDAFRTTFTAAGVVFRRIIDSDQGRIFPHTVEPVGQWVIEADGEIAATGGVLFHYNPPYGDIHMEVAERFRRRGYGSYLVQELKRTCYEMGKVPAARCEASNTASRATLQKAGLLPCARMLTGAIGA